MSKTDNMITLIQLKKFSLLNNYFMFFDTSEFVIEKLLYDSGIKIRYDSVFESSSEKYMLIIAKVRKWDSDKFVTLFEKMPNAMSLRGDNDYEQCFGDFLDKITDGLSKK